MINVIDGLIIAGYLAATVAVGIACRGSQRDIDDYFAVGRGMRGRLATFFVGVSIAPISGLSLLAIPSIFYQHGWKYLVVLPTLPLLWYGLHRWYFPRLFAGSVRHAYDLVEAHFGPRVRTAASVMFVALRIGWMAALVYAPTLVVLTLLGLDQSWFWPVTLTVGCCCTVYAVFGGLRGVIVTDALQTLVMMAGIAFVVGFIALRSPVPVGPALAELTRSGRLPVADFSAGLAAPFTFWAILLGWIVTNGYNYTADQMAMQRFLATGSAGGASRSFAINMAGTAVTLLLLCGIGVLLAVWYAHHRDPGLPAAADRVMPYFVARELPPGISGLLLASILAGTMSAMTSGINTLAGSLTNDFLVRFGRPRPPAELLRFARWSSGAIGAAATLVAGAVHRLGTLFEIQLRILSTFQGPLLAVVTLLLLQVRVRPAPLIAGLVAGVAAGTAVTFSGVDPQWVGPAAWLVTLGAAAGLERLAPRGVAGGAGAGNGRDSA
ncbi:MAG: hypothetical protein JNG83_12325 [Opitutaceae bacterium]|nr:hypothetical protein [Opitutaceae bacterium]